MSDFSDTTIMEVKTPTVSFGELMEGGAAEIYVGPNKKLYTIPRALLCYHSEYFKRSLNSGSVEAAEGAIHLFTDDPETFILLLEWMYKGTLRVFENFCWEADDYRTALQQTCLVLCKLFCMADRLIIPGVEDYIVSQLNRAFDSAGDDFPIDSATIMAVYNNTPERSAFQKYLLEKLTVNLISPTGHHIEKYKELVEGPDAIPGFAVNLIAKMKDFRSHEYWCKAVL
ncbi:hypothetical protein P7C71_g4199, partial [Lecanoromycetidae sp. Uapishka_2]